ncbi:MAG: NAD(P)-dependent glycerol-3-phosphate dehydrogenase [Planctomyces sp.]|nr:NAD(P)-dependent glycerol-3-phosphate dehydrogenase [Planctomyces sp.]
MSSNVTVVGGGAMGTACAWVLAQNRLRNVRMWARNPTFARHIEETRENSRLLPGIRLPENVRVMSDSATAFASAEAIVVCVPTRGLRDAFTELKSYIPESAVLVSAVKGIENSTLERPSQILQQVLGTRPVVALGGPCHAEEVARRKPASVVAACDQPEVAEYVQNLLSTDFLRVYANSDLTGVEFAGALKNVIAIAAGICDGLDYGDNARSALLTRGLAEMVRFGISFGTQPETFYGLAGVGDLTATCCSRHSRNRAVGEMLGRGMTLSQIQQSMNAVAEGIFTAKSVVEIAQQNGIDMPIARAVYEVLFENKNPAEATQQLMRRPLRAE